jgi:carbamoyl-phosphate synthase large subunit
MRQSGTPDLGDGRAGEKINKIGEAPPRRHCIRSGEVDLVINTPTGSGARADGYEIRTAAVKHGIPCVTTMTGASAASRHLRLCSRRRRCSTLQELHRRRSASHRGGDHGRGPRDG